MELYRYRAIDNRLRDLLIFGRAWFASPKSFNDPFDCRLPLKFNPTEKQLRAFLKSASKRLQAPKREALRKFEIQRDKAPAAFENKVAEIRKNLTDSILDSSSLMCFSTHQADILMFSHYGDLHKGVSVGFDARALLATGRLTRVRYSETYPELDYLKLRDRPTDLMAAMYLTKAKQWEYEDEFRLIRHDHSEGPFDFPLSTIRSVTFGCECPMSRADDVRLWCRDAGRDIRFYQAYRSTTNFRLEILST